MFVIVTVIVESNNYRIGAIYYGFDIDIENYRFLFSMY